MKMDAFDFDDYAVRVMVRDDEPWFVAADVCRVLEIANARDAVAGLEDDEKGVGTADTLGGSQKMNLISESGLYALIFKSRKPEARRFRKWITSEVIPAIRRTGRYEAGSMAPAPAVITQGQWLDDVRHLLRTSAQAVLDKTLDVGRAQQIANLAARYMETLKLESDALGYEAVFGVRAESASQQILRDAQNGTAAGKMQTVLERGMPAAAGGESGVPAAAAGGAAPMGAGEPGPDTVVPSTLPGEGDL